MHTDFSRTGVAFRKCLCLLAAAALLAGNLTAAHAQATPEADPAVAETEAVATQVAWIEVSEPLRETPLPFSWLSEDDAGPSLSGVLDTLAAVRTDPSIKGAVIFLDQPGLPLTQCTAIADAMLAAREAGKTILVFAEVYSLSDYLLASAADSILLQHKGSVELSGLAIEEMYLADMFAKIGVKPDLLQVGQYKGADETWMRAKPSPAWDENFDQLLDGLYKQTVERITRGRSLTQAELEALMADAWTMTDQQLLQAKLVDQLVDRDLLDVTGQFFGEDFEWYFQAADASPKFDAANPFALLGTLFKEPELRTRRPTLAVLHADGAIYSGDSTTEDSFFGEASIGSRTLIAALEDALLDDNIKGAIIRIDSPGGSALASEVIWQAAREFQSEKPLFAVVGSMAASGGYYIVSATDQIYVQPHSILGSIGVVGGKIALGGVYDWAGVHIVRRTRGPGADLFNSVEPFTPPQREKVRQALTVVYEQFLDRVRLGRGDRIGELSEVAQGRLFTGADAIANGMADHLGGVTEALAELAKQCDLAEGSYDVVHLPTPQSFSAYLEGMFGVRSGVVAPAGVSLPQLAVVRQLLGPAAWTQVSRHLRGLLMLRDEAALTLLPIPLVIGR